MESIEWSLITLREFLHSSPNDWNDYEHAKQEALEAYFVISDHLKSPHPIVTQPETNLPISGLGGYDQVLRDEFEDGKK